MTTLIVLAHPLKPSLSSRFAQIIGERLEQEGQTPRTLDLYETDFDPVLSRAERSTYYTQSSDDTAGLASCTRLVLVFPTWWFGMPAILKGWIDRSFMPGVAYDHASDLSALTGRLVNLQHVVVVTTLGSPKWVDTFVLRAPVKRALKWGVFKACAPNACFRMLSLYSAENVSPARLAKFELKLHRILDAIK